MSLSYAAASPLIGPYASPSVLPLTPVMPATSLLADDDDETLERAAPSDVDAAITYLLTSFPFQPPSPHYLEPRTILFSQLYCLVADRTAVDREVDKRRRANEVRVMRCAQLGVDEYAMMTTEDYVAVVRSMWRVGGGGGKVAAGEERKEEEAVGTADTATSSSLLAPNSQPIRRKRPRTETAASPPRPPLSPSARQPVVPLSRPASDSPSSSSSRILPASVSPSAIASTKLTVPDEDKENVLSGVVVSLPAPAPHRAPVTAAAARSTSLRAADQQLLLDTLIHSFLPGYTDVTITRGELLSRLHDGLPYQQMTGDDVISTLFHYQLVAHNTHSTTVSSSTAALTSYLLLLPHTVHLIHECLEARQYITRLIERSRYKQLRKSELEGRVRLPCTERGVRWHMLEMLGCERLLEVETTKGTVVRVNGEYKGRVRR